MAYTPSLADIQAQPQSPTAVNAAQSYVPSLHDIPTQSSQQMTPQQVPQQQNPEPTLMNMLGGNDIPGQVKAAGEGIRSLTGAGVAGMANFGADVGETALSAATYLPSKLMQHLGIISPETADNIAKSIHEGANQFRSTPNVDSTDMFEKAAGQHPFLAGGLEIGGDIYAGGKALSAGGEAATAFGDSLGPTATSLGAGATATKATQIIGGVAARAASMGLLGQAMDSNQDTKTQSFLLNAALSPGIDATGKLISYAGTKVGVVDSLKKLVDSANEKLGGLTTDERMGGAISNTYGAAKAVENKWYEVVKGTNFSQADQAATYNLGREINDFIYTNGDKLSTIQKSVLMDASDSLASSGSHADTLKLLQSLNGKFNQFSGANASDSIYNFFKDTQGQLRGIITDAAEREGNGAAMARANLIHERMIKPMQEIGADDITEAVQKYGMGSDEVKQVTNNIINKYVDTKGVGKITQLLNASGNEGSNIISQNIVKNLFDTVGQDPNFSYGKASDKLGAYIAKYDGILSQPAIDSLKGAQNILKESESALQKSSSKITTHLVGGAIGGGLAYKMSGENPTAGTIGTIAGYLGGPIVVRYTQSLLNTPTGQNFLRSLAKPGAKMGAVRDVIKAMGVMGINKLSGSSEQQ